MNSEKISESDLAEPLETEKQVIICLIGSRCANLESPYRHVQSLPRSATTSGSSSVTSSALKVLTQPAPTSSHSAKAGLPPRASSFHQKSRSTGGLIQPFKQRKVSLDHIPVFGDSDEESPCSSKTEVHSRINSNESSKSCQINRTRATPRSENHPSCWNKDLSIGKDVNTTTAAGSQFSLGCLQSSSESETDERLEIKPEEDILPVKELKYRTIRGRRCLSPEVEGIIRPGKVAEILHRFSSTNRGSIRSVYYDSNSDDENNWKSPTGQDEVDHLSIMLDNTLDDLDYASE